MPAEDVFKVCVKAILAGELIHRVSSTDKEFHFQNWFKARLEHAGHNFEIPMPVAALVVPMVPVVPTGVVLALMDLPVIVLANGPRAATKWCLAS